MIVLDSDILIDVLKARSATLAALEALEASGEELATTSINASEVLRGTSEGGRHRIAAESLLSSLVEIPFGPRAARRYANMMNAADRLGAPLPALDAMIAAATVEAGARLATRNTRHFAKMAGLETLTI